MRRMQLGQCSKTTLQDVHCFSVNAVYIQYVVLELHSNTQRLIHRMYYIECNKHCIYTVYYTVDTVDTSANI